MKQDFFLSPATKIAALTSANHIFTLLREELICRQNSGKLKNRRQQKKRWKKWTIPNIELQIILCFHYHFSSFFSIILAVAHTSKGFAADIIFFLISRSPCLYSRGSISVLFYLSQFFNCLLSLGKLLIIFDVWMACSLPIHCKEKQTSPTHIRGNFQTS